MRPAPWQALAKAGPPVVPASTHDAVPIEPGTSTGCPTVRRSAGRSGWPGPTARRVARLRPVGVVKG